MTLELIFRLILSFILSGVVGLEREVKYKPAGLRTHILVGVGSALFTILSLEAFPGADTARVASYIIAGIGFIGAGTIIQTKEKIVGITTAGSIWITAAIGMAAGAGFYLIAIVVTILAYFTLKLEEIEKKIRKWR